MLRHGFSIETHTQPEGFSDESSRGEGTRHAFVRVHGAISRLRRRITADAKERLVTKSYCTTMTSHFVVGS